MPHVSQHMFYALADDFFLIHLKKCFGIFLVFVKSFRIRPNNFLWVFFFFRCRVKTALYLIFHVFLHYFLKILSNVCPPTTLSSSTYSSCC